MAARAERIVAALPGKPYHCPNPACRTEAGVSRTLHPADIGLARAPVRCRCGKQYLSIRRGTGMFPPVFVVEVTSAEWRRLEASGADGLPRLKLLGLDVSPLEAAERERQARFVAEVSAALDRVTQKANRARQ